MALMMSRKKSAGALALLTASHTTSASATYTLTDDYAKVYVNVADGLIGGETVSQYATVTCSNSRTVTEVAHDGVSKNNDGVGHGCTIATYVIDNCRAGDVITIGARTSGYATLAYIIMG